MSPIKLQLAELDEVVASDVAEVEVLTPKLVERARATLAAGKRVPSTAKELALRLLVTMTPDLSTGGRHIASFEAEYCAIAPQVIALHVVFPAAYPAETPCRITAATSDSFRAGHAESFRTELQAFLEAFVGSPCLEAAIQYTLDNAAPFLQPLYCACFLDIAINGEEIGRLVVELSTQLTPKCTENFRALCTGEKGKCQGGAKRSSGAAMDLCFRGTSFARILSGQFAHGGDLSRGGNAGGDGGESIYGLEPWPDENFVLRHDRPFVLAMANGGPNTNGSQFFVTFKPAPSLDGKHTVFGVCRTSGDGWEVDQQESESERVLKAMEAVGTPSGKVKGDVAVTIVDCGQLAEPNT